MPHAAIIGMTESGKTYCARHLARLYRSRNFQTLVLHKPDEPWSNDEVSIQTSDLEIFLEQIDIRNQENDKLHKELGILEEQLKGFVCFMELSDADSEKYDTRIHKLFTAGRHKAHMFHYLSQRSAIVHPTIRENCGILYLFTCHHTQAKAWATEFNDDELLKACNIPFHTFYHKKDRVSPAILSKI